MGRSEGRGVGALRQWIIQRVCVGVRGSVRQDSSDKSDKNLSGPVATTIYSDQMSEDLFSFNFYFFYF
jgi:hypothetical protein